MKKKIAAFFGDSVLIYTVLIIMSVMYHYRSEMTLIYGLAALICCALLFKLFDFIAKHKFIGPLTYILAFVIGVVCVDLCIKKGAETYPINFGIWFLTPQDALDYSPLYTFAMFIIMTGFFSSVIYYFTKIRYRIFMGFLIFIIPFALYGKEYEKMPVYFIIILAMMYFITMINYRQINSQNVNVSVVGKQEMWKCALLFSLVFGSAAAILPKPVIEADRSVLEELINADQFTDRLLNTISIFNDTASSSRFNSIPTSDEPLYYAQGVEPLRLKTQTYTNYDYNTDSWSPGYDDDHYKTSEDANFDNDITSGLYALALAAELDNDFAEKYNLTGVTSENIAYPRIIELTLYTSGHSAQLVPVPTLYQHIEGSGGSEDIRATYSANFFKNQGYFDMDEQFKMSYFQDWFLYDEEVRQLLSAISYKDTYYDILDDALDVLFENDYISEYSDLSELSSDDYDDFLDYGNNTKIKNLADEITEGLTSDYEKARAIEVYFLEQNFVYDLGYQKGSGDNAETFLFESHTGVCFEYATAMVLLSRAAGIPARYAEGYSMSEQLADVDGNSQFVIRPRDAHGFPELFIGGVGWVSFEPTVSDLQGDTNDIVSSTKNLYISGIVLILLGILIFTGVKLYPIAYQYIFKIRINKADPNNTVYLIMIRIKSLYKVDKAKTSTETVDIIREKDDFDASVIAEMFDLSIYGQTELNLLEKQKAISMYEKLYDVHIENNKKRRRVKK